MRDDLGMGRNMLNDVVIITRNAMLGISAVIDSDPRGTLKGPLDP